MVQVYGKEECVQCKYTVKKLNENDIPHEYHDIETEPEAKRVVESSGRLQLPLVVAGDQKWHGFRPDHIKALT